MQSGITAVAIIVALSAGCAADAEPERADGPILADPESTQIPSDDESVAPDTESLDPDAIELEPVPYVPAGQPGSAGDYADLIARLEDEIPSDLQNQVPWPDLRNPNPVVVQIQIFDLWIWMEENYPEPVLAEAMAAPGSPSREEITGVFGQIDRENVLQVRNGAGYEAFDHVVVTFESAGLPLWLRRDVPEDAVVVYYHDKSGPIDVIDRETRAFIEQYSGSATRMWLSIMVPTDVGWQLWRDRLIEPNDSELEIPDVPPPPGLDEALRKPEV